MVARYDAARTDFDRVLKQRNALLRGGLRDDDARTTLDVFDEQLVAPGPSWCAAACVSSSASRPPSTLLPRTGAGDPARVTARYEAEWTDGA